MRNGWLLSMLLATTLAGADQKRQGMVMIWPLPHDLYVAVNTVCEPLRAGNSPFSCFSGDSIGGTMRINPSGHILTSRQNKTWVGYSFDAEKTGDGDSIRFTMAATAGPGPEGLTQLPLPKVAGGPVMIAPGDIVRIPLLFNPTTGQTLIDEVAIFTHPVTGEEAFGDPMSTADPRDLTLQDVEMKWLDGTVFLNGKEMQTIHGGGKGAVVWYSYEGLGTAALSFLPQPAPSFEKAGTIHGRTMQFQIGSDVYKWTCPEPILPADGVYNLYVHWDPRTVKAGAHGSTETGEHALAAINGLFAE